MPEAGVTGMCSVSSGSELDCSSGVECIDGAECFETKCVGVPADGTLDAVAPKSDCVHTVASVNDFCTNRSFAQPISHDGATLFVCLP